MAVRKRKQTSFLKKLRRHKKTKDTPYAALASVMVLFVIGVITIFSAEMIRSARMYSSELAAVINAVLVDLANTDRAAAGLDGLTFDPLLALAAQQKADDMAAKGYFAHTSPDGKQPWDWVSNVGYEYETAGENLAVRFNDSEQVEQAWMDSPTHRANLLNGKFTHVGIATAQGIYKGEQTVFVVQMFARPRARATEPLPETTTPVLAVNDTPAQERPMVSEPAPGETEPAEDIVVLGATEDRTQARSDIVTQTVPELAPIQSEKTATPVVEALEHTGDSMVVAQNAPVEKTQNLSLWSRILASPWSYLRALFILCAFGMIAAAGYVLYNELHQRHFKHSVYVVAVTSLAGVLFFVADAVFFAQPIVL